MANTGTRASGGAAGYLPEQQDLRSLRAAAQGCHGCSLHEHATRTVFGAGPAPARLVLLGEQPGDAEDFSGEPFVGPAGQLLDRLLADAGLDRAAAYLTNAVKHVKFVPAEHGLRRIHKTPVSGEIRACFPWLAAELRVVQPELVVCLGATAAQALLGPAFRLGRHRGELLPGPPGPHGEPPRWQVLPTVHPAAVLRAPDPAEARAALTADLTAAARALSG